MVMECLQDQLASTGGPYNDDPVNEDQMEFLSEYLLTREARLLDPAFAESIQVTTHIRSNICTFA